MSGVVPRSIYALNAMLLQIDVVQGIFQKTHPLSRELACKLSEDYLCLGEPTFLLGFGLKQGK